MQESHLEIHPRCFLETIKRQRRLPNQKPGPCPPPPSDNEKLPGNIDGRPSFPDLGQQPSCWVKPSDCKSCSPEHSIGFGSVFIFIFSESRTKTRTWHLQGMLSATEPTSQTPGIYFKRCWESNYPPSFFLFSSRGCSNLTAKLSRGPLRASAC